MSTWMHGAAVGAAAVLGLAASALGQLGPEEGPLVVLGARRLGALPKAPLKLPAGGAWHAWAWQRGGAEVAWTIGGKALPPTKADAAADAYGWVALGAMDLPAGQAVAIGCVPAGGKDPNDAVAALVLSRDAGCDPAKLCRLARVWPDAPLSAADERLKQCRHLNMRFTMPQYATKAAWEARAAWLREHIRVSCGLLPEPPRTELKPQVFGKLERDGYTVEKVFIESRPGFYVCGNLFRPRGEGKKGPFPAVACPHGHWAHGRLQDVVQARCISLARLGYVVFAWDMIGYNDSGKQLGKHRGVISSDRNELWGLSPMHLQSWNTIRAIDFLQSLPDVDRTRIGLTGCSGGGTQTFMVMGIDERVTAAAPVCMVSGIMQGGCECENAPLLRIETNNIEIASLMAPRPLIVPSVSGDWTKETPKVEYPSIRGVYALYDAAGRVTNPHAEGGHGYPQPHREAVYGFFRRYLQGAGDGNAIPEPPFQVEKAEDMLIWQGRELPADARTPETVITDIVAECRRQRDELLPRSEAGRKRFEDTLGAAFRHAILAELPKAADLAVEELGAEEVGDMRIARLLLGRKGIGDQVPAILYRPKGASGKRPACIVVHADGKAALIDPSGRPGELLGALLAAGQDVLAVDTYLTGEFLSPIHAVRQKKEGGFFSVYNRTPLVQRVQDILTAAAYLQFRPETQGIGLAGVGKAGAWCALAAPLLPPDAAIAADLAGLAGDEDGRWLDDLFTPCILKAGDVRTAVALAAPRRMLVHNLAGGYDVAAFRAAYAAAGAAGRIRVEPAACAPKAIADWLAGRADAAASSPNGAEGGSRGRQPTVAGPSVQQPRRGGRNDTMGAVRVDSDRFVCDLAADARAAVEVAPGSILAIHCRSALDREVGPGPTRAAAANPATGPIAVKGARAGQALRVEILDIQVESPGHIGGSPGGDADAVEVRNGHVLYHGLAVPIAPMIGVLGVAPAGGSWNTMDSGPSGGNLDTNDIAPGACITIPIRQDGGLLVLGDVHAVMGDGEIGGQGLECAATVTLKVGIEPAPLSDHIVIRRAGRIMTIGTGQTIEQAVRDASAAMAALIAKATGLDSFRATKFLGLAGQTLFGQHCCRLKTVRVAVPMEYLSGVMRNTSM